MGPNSIRLLDELMSKVDISSCSRILDLGCGTGLTSMFISKETKSKVFAVDLWCSATDNYNRFKQWEIDNKTIPIHADINDLPFANDYFDAIVSVDAFHYFSDKPNFFQDKILPLVKYGGVVVMAVPGLKEEYHGREPSQLFLDWISDDTNEYRYYHCCDWWKNYIGKCNDIQSINIFQLENFDIAWKEWLASGQKYSVRDKKFFELGIGQYLNFVGMIIRKN